MRKLFSNGKWALTISVICVIFNSFSNTMSAFQQTALYAHNCEILLLGVVIWLIFKKPEEIYHFHEYEVEDDSYNEN